MKILDCTLRDGGYYTNWDFDKTVVDAYIETTNKLPIDYLEIGYRTMPSKEYLGKYGYCPIFELEDLREKSTKKLVAMLNEKETAIEHLDQLLKPIKGLVDMIRIAIDPQNIDRAVKLAEAVKSYGFEVGFNTMYMSNWKNLNFYPKLKNITGIADLFCMVDSYGGVTPNDVITCMDSVREYTDCPIGFHGHNNLELGLINTITAIDHKIDYIDATILGMGRGAGNLKMELLLTYLNKQGLDIDFNVLGDAITAFTPLLKKYEWGTNLPYMLSGANSFPQKDVMDWASNRVYSFNSIVRALNNKKDKVKDNAKYPLLDEKKYKNIIIIGGGENATLHMDGIKAFIKQNPEGTALIFATGRHSKAYQGVEADLYYCLTGSEGKRLTKVLGKEINNGTCVLAPYPRTMGSEVPENASQSTYEISAIEFTTTCLDSCTTLALQLALNLSEGEIYIAGYDGYPDGIRTDKERDLTQENIAIFKDINTFLGKKLKTITPSLYNELELVSIYQFIK